MFEVDEVHIVTAVAFGVRQRRAESRAVVRARVKNVKPGVFQLHQRAHHKRHRVQR